MDLLDAIAKRVGYVKASELSAYEALLEEARKNEEHLQAKVSSLEGKIADYRSNIADMELQLAQYMHAAEESARVQAGLNDALSRRGISLYQLLNEAPRINLPQIDTANKLYKTLEQMPEIAVARIRDLRTGNGSHISSISAYIAYNVITGKVVQLPEGRIKDSSLRVAQIFKDLGIEDRLTTYSEQH